MLATLTMPLVGTGVGWGAGLISFKVSDRASSALSASASSWMEKHKDKMIWMWLLYIVLVCVRLKADWAVLVFYLWGSLCGNTCSRLHCWSSSGGNKVSCQGIQSQVCRGLRDGQNDMLKICIGLQKKSNYWIIVLSELHSVPVK